MRKFDLSFIVAISVRYVLRDSWRLRRGVAFYVPCLVGYPSFVTSHQSNPPGLNKLSSTTFHSHRPKTFASRSRMRRSQNADMACLEVPSTSCCAGQTSPESLVSSRQELARLLPQASRPRIPLHSDGDGCSWREKSPTFQFSS